MSNDDFKMKNKFKIYMLFIWLPALAITIWYIVEQTQAYKSAIANPASTILIEEKDRLALPQVTICNWNQNTNASETCLECELHLESCSYNTTIDCSLLWSKRQYITSAGIFSCYDFNAFPLTPMYSDTTGYSGSFATVWSVNLLPRFSPPQNRAGVQASFFAPGAITPDMIYDEIRFAAVGFDSFYSLQLITTIHSELPFFDPNYNNTAYDTPVTSVNLLSAGKKKVANDTVGYIGITFGFQSLSQQTIYFGISYSLSSLFGDLASIIGTIMGLDLIKVSVGFCLIFISYKHGTIDFIADLFNG